MHLHVHFIFSLLLPALEMTTKEMTTKGLDVVVQQVGRLAGILNEKKYFVLEDKSQASPEDYVQASLFALQIIIGFDNEAAVEIGRAVFKDIFKVDPNSELIHADPKYKKLKDLIIFDIETLNEIVPPTGHGLKLADLPGPRPTLEHVVRMSLVFQEMSPNVSIVDMMTTLAYVFDCSEEEMKTLALIVKSAVTKSTNLSKA